MSSYQRNTARTLQPQHNNGISAGIIISSMAVPPQKAPNGALLKSPTTSSKQEIKSSTSAIADSAEIENLKKKIEEYIQQLKEKEKAVKALEKDVKEKTGQLKSKDLDIKSLQSDKESMAGALSKLEKENSSLKQQLDKNKQEIDRLEGIINSKKAEANYKEMYEQEVKSHQHTNELFKLTADDLKKKALELQEMREAHRLALEALKTEQEDRYNKMELAKNQEIKDRDDRLQRMKRQMADTLTGNSHERQQQIDELTRELNKVTSECDTLRMRLSQSGSSKSLNKPEPNANCGNCKNLMAHLEKKEWTIKEKKQKIEELNSLCSRFEGQLKQQESLLALSKEQKSRTPQTNGH